MNLLLNYHLTFRCFIMLPYCSLSFVVDINRFTSLIASRFPEQLFIVNNRFRHIDFYIHALIYLSSSIFYVRIIHLSKCIPYFWKLSEINASITEDTSFRLK